MEKNLKKANLHETKNNLSKKRRSSGDWAGKIKIKEDFDELPNNFMRYFKIIVVNKGIGL